MAPINSGRDNVKNASKRGFTESPHKKQGSSMVQSGDRSRPKKKQKLAAGNSKALPEESDFSDDEDSGFELELLLIDCSRSQSNVFPGHSDMQRPNFIDTKQKQFQLTETVVAIASVWLGLHQCGNFLSFGDEKLVRIASSATVGDITEKVTCVPRSSVLIMPLCLYPDGTRSRLKPGHVLLAVAELMDANKVHLIIYDSDTGVSSREIIRAAAQKFVRNSHWLPEGEVPCFDGDSDEWLEVLQAKRGGIMGYKHATHAVLDAFSYMLSIPHKKTTERVGTEDFYSYLRQIINLAIDGRLDRLTIKRFMLDYGYAIEEDPTRVSNPTLREEQQNSMRSVLMNQGILDSVINAWRASPPTENPVVLPSISSFQTVGELEANTTIVENPVVLPSISSFQTVGELEANTTIVEKPGEEPLSGKEKQLNRETPEKEGGNQEPFYLRFYDPNIAAADLRNRTLPMILAWDDLKLESDQTYIMTLFPLRPLFTPTPLANQLQQADIDAFQARPDLRDSLRRALDRLLAFYGFQRMNTGHGVRITPRSNFNEASGKWLTGNRNPNLFRISRILRSLILLSLVDEAMAFFAALEEVHAVSSRSVGKTVPHEDYQRWRAAVDIMKSKDLGSKDIMARTDGGKANNAGTPEELPSTSKQWWGKFRSNLDICKAKKVLKDKTKKFRRLHDSVDLIDENVVLAIGTVWESLHHQGIQYAFNSTFSFQYGNPMMLPVVSGPNPFLMPLIFMPKTGAIGHHLLAVAEQALDSVAGFRVTVYDSSPGSVTRREISKMVMDTIISGGWAAALPEGVEPKFEFPEVPHQSQGNTCGIHTIFAGWAVLLDLPIVRSREPIAYSRFYKGGRTLTNLALSGCLDSATIESYFRWTGFSPLDGPPATRVITETQEIGGLGAATLDEYINNQRIIANSQIWPSTLQTQ